MSGLLTCITCNVGFHESDLQRAHYKSDWHRYNLKRKVIQLSPVTEEDFKQRVQQQEQQQSSQDSGQANVNPSYCFTCKKSFGNDKAFQNHLFSKKHLQLDGSTKGQANENDEEMSEVQPKTQKIADKLKVDEREPAGLLAESTKRKEKVQEEDKKKSIFDDDEESEDSWEEVEGFPIPVNHCLFCEHESEDMDTNLVHMSTEHSFFIPDAEYCNNVEGLLEYLGEKVGEGLVCLWCNEKGKSFYTVKSVQQHMTDKGHCKILHEGDNIFEYTDFYDYSTSYPDGADVNADEPYLPELIHFNDNMQLVLPSGITLGHRSLKIYYKQYIRPGSQLVSRATKRRHNLLSQYKAIGGTGCTTLAEAQRKHKDQQFFKRVHDKYRLRVGMNGNKVNQMHYRHQVPV